MKAELMTLLQKEAQACADHWTNRVKYSSGERYEVIRGGIIALGETIALVKLRKDRTGNPLFVFFYYLKNQKNYATGADDGWKWFLPTDVHVGGMEQFCEEYRKQFKQEYST